MKWQIEKSAGVGLLAGSLLMFLTMVLHPVGGNLQHLQKMSRFIVISHSLALLAIPFLAVGFWGLTKKMGASYFLPVLSFATVLVGLLAGMIAATINGLALPVYVQQYDAATPGIEAAIKPILRNNIALNQGFDFVFIGAMTIAIFLWSVCILTFKKLPRLAGYSGLLVSLSVLVMLATGYVFVNLHGFRIFILGNVFWILWVGIAMMRSPGSDSVEDR